MDWLNTILEWGNVCNLFVVEAILCIAIKFPAVLQSWDGKYIMEVGECVKIDRYVWLWVLKHDHLVRDGNYQNTKLLSCFYAIF